MPKWTCEFLRREFLPERIREIDKLDRPERIYISRAKARRRKVINEAEVLKFLGKFGFKDVSLELMSIAEQALLFYSAKVVITPHGAGLTNLAFCSPKVKVIEIFSPNYVNCCYWILSNWVGAEYYYIFGEGKMPPEYMDPFQRAEDILINLGTLSDAIKFAGVT